MWSTPSDRERAAEMSRLDMEQKVQQQQAPEPKPLTIIERLDRWWHWAFVDG